MGTVKDADSNKGGIADAERVSLLQDTAIATVRVGKDAKSWILHKSLLNRHSPFFAAALNGSFKEATTNTVELDDDDPESFQLFVQWLYTGEIKADMNDLPTKACRAWALGDKLQCPAFQDSAMLRLIGYHRDEFLTEDTMRLIYTISPPGSKLRKFAVGQLCWDRSCEKKHPFKAVDIMAVEDFNRNLLECFLLGGRAVEDPSDEASPSLSGSCGRRETQDGKGYKSSLTGVISSVRNLPRHYIM
ncbi:MAG: hypothetical protein Q9198_004938 [Flavoplaca austrocitrina]